jgi:glutathione S-transferase
VILYDNVLDADAYPVRLLLSLLGLACERVTIDSSPLALRGHGPRGPVLEDGGARVVGAAAVLRHLAARHAPEWLPASPGPGDSLLTSLTSPRFAPRQARLLALFTAEGPPPGLVEEATHRLQELDDHLTLGEFDGQPWFAGERPAIVDLAAFGPAALSNDYGVEHDAFPALRRWIRRVRALPGFIPMPGVPQFY